MDKKYSVVNRNSIQQHSLLLITVTVVLGVPLLLYSTSASMVNKWIESETFTHGFLIFPISLWLIWQRRAALEPLIAKYDPLALPFFLGAAVGWFLGTIVDVLVVQQFGMILLILSTLWLLTGRTVITTLLFPLLYLFFAVPFGENLIPPLMDLTAETTVALIRASGIPVYQEGLYFSLPSGNWSVVQACSGIRYLIASFALGSLFAYITYNSYYKRSIFILCSLLVPIIANSLRAYMIVMIGHISGMEYATGVDHLIYGWLFFGVVLFIMFFIGSFWRETIVLQVAATNPEQKTDNSLPYKPMVAVLVLLLVLQAVAALLNSAPQTTPQYRFSLPQTANGWQQNTNVAPLPWQPQTGSADATMQTVYSNGNSNATIYIAQYHYQRQNSEVLGSKMVPEEDNFWTMTSARKTTLGQSPVIETKLVTSHKQRYQIYHWYLIGGTVITNPYIAKIEEVVHLLLTGKRDATLIAVATNTDNGFDRDAMTALIATLQQQITISIDE